MGRRRVAGYKKAATVDDHYADLHFRLARCYLATGDTQAAKIEFALARDWDALQFRTDSRLNDIIREVGSAYAGKRVHLVDMDSGLATSPLCPDGIAGERVFNDHVHYNFDGGYELARLLLPTVVRVLQQDRGLVPVESTDIPSRDECAKRLAFTAWDEADTAAGIAKMLARPPFLDQLDHSARQARLEKRISETTGRIDQAFVDDVVKSYDDAIKLNPGDWAIRYNYANFLYQLQRYPQAMPHIQYVVNTFGQIAAFRVLLGYCLAGSGYVDQGIEQFRKARQLDRHSKPIKDALAWALQRKRELSQRTLN
jgi:tetratricopeptide (TPR) repeat protein